jgi:hypothetical protein
MQLNGSIKTDWNRKDEKDRVGQKLKKRHTVGASLF